MAGSVRGTAAMIAAMVPDEDRKSWLVTLAQIRKQPERRNRRWS
jgi:hypothetical protein